jgi:predicted cupin superfamily sugar epimerase
VRNRDEHSGALGAADVISRLGLLPLPDEGGYYRLTWESPLVWGSPSYSETERVCGTAIYYLLTCESEGFSAFHSLDVDEVYHFYCGDPVELYIWEKECRRVELGPDLASGQVPQAVVPAGAIQGSRLIAGGKWALLGTTMAPGYAREHFRLIGRAELLEKFPEQRPIIVALTRR